MADPRTLALSRQSFPPSREVSCGGADRAEGGRAVHMWGIIAGDHHRVDGWSGEPVSELKERVRRLTGIAPTQQSLSFRFQELNP